MKKQRGGFHAANPEGARRTEATRPGEHPAHVACGTGFRAGLKSQVNVGLGNERNPTRADVQDWLPEKERDQERLAADRHRQLLRWAGIAGVAAVLAVIVGVIGVVVAPGK
jgi:hypothetical protein